MDYQEAIEYMRKESHNQCVNSEGQDAYIIAVSAMQELQEYKQLGTLEEMKLLKATHLTGVELAQISCMLKQLAEYEKIGTLEEVRETVEKQKEERPRPVLGIFGGEEYECRECGNTVEYMDDYCKWCGQKLNWSEVEE